MPKALRIHLVDRDPQVRAISQEVAEQAITTPQMQRLFDAMIEAMIRSNGVGIAGCQVGKNVRVIVISKDYADTDEHLVVINPRLVSVSKKTHTMEEGCLSVPGIYGSTERFVKARVKGVLRDGTAIDLKVKGMLARIFQHEIDHLDGTLFIDTATNLHPV